AGSYKITSSLTAADGANVSLVGAGKYSTQIQGSFAGYIINREYTVDNGVASPFIRIEGLYIKNSSSLPGAGAIRNDFAANSSIYDCYIQGKVGIDISRDCFNAIVSNCVIAAPFPSGTANTVGIYAGQSTIDCCSLAGWDTRIMVGATALPG